MCTHPLNIKNKSKTCIDGVTRSNLMVPCGKCEDCRSSKADDWFQRIYEEINQCAEHGGKTIYTTLTYNNINVPRFYYVDNEGNERSFMCFNKQHKDRFANDLRMYFRRKFSALGMQQPSYSYPFKLIFCSEYGLDDRYTHRPHYHVLLHIPKEWLDVEGYDEVSWKKLIRHYWSDFPINHGFVRWSPGNSIFVNSEFAGIYASKYICKDLEFYQQPDVEEYMKGVTVSRKDKKYMAVHQFLPHHWQSEYYGASLERIYSVKENYVNGFDFNIPSELKRGKTVKRKCPMYIEKRLLYKVNDLGQMKLNQLGKEFKSEKFFQDINKSVRRYMKFLDSHELEGMINLDDIKNSDRLSVFPNHQAIIDYVSSVLTSQHNRHSDEIVPKPLENGVMELVLYNRVWSGLWSWHQSEVKALDNLDYTDFVFQSCEQYIQNLYFSDSDGDRFNPDGVFSDFDPGLEGAYFYDQCKRFYDFRLVLDIIGDIQSIFRDRCHAEYIRNRNIIKENKFLTQIA